MTQILQKYDKFSIKELEQFAANPGSCVFFVNTDFKNALHEVAIRTKVGVYNADLNGIMIGIKNIKALGQTAALRADDPALHVNINADCYVFRPRVGAVLRGVVGYISKHQISAIIYRVFNATIRLTSEKRVRGIAMKQEITFRIKEFNISNGLPYIEGEILR